MLRGVILAEVVGQIADGVVELVGLRLEIGGDLGHVLDRLDLDLRVLLVPGTGLGALEPIAHGRARGRSEQDPAGPFRGPREVGYGRGGVLIIA